MYAGTDEACKEDRPRLCATFALQPPSATFAFAYDRPFQDEGNNRVKRWVMVIIMLKAAATQENCPICRIPISFLHASISDAFRPPRPNVQAPIHNRRLSALCNARPWLYHSGPLTPRRAMRCPIKMHCRPLHCLFSYLNPKQ
jgi:hypothetical protein